MSECIGKFDRDTAVTPLGEGRFGVSLHGDWWAVVGPNGGYLAALVLRGMTEVVADAARAPRSLHVRYLSTAQPGEAQLWVTTLRAGRTVSVLSARLLQDGKELVTASAAFGVPASKVRFCDARMPVLPPVEACPAAAKGPPISERYAAQRGFGPALRSGEVALTGGYIRLEEPRTPDALLVAAVWDAWAPAPLYRRIEERFGGAAPTLEASVYFRATLPLADATPTDRLVVRVESLAATEGFFEESGEIWSPSGVLLAQSRQLAMLY